MSLWACLCHWLPQLPMDAEGAQNTFPPPLHALLRSMLVAFSQLPNAKMLCRSSLVSLASLSTSNSVVAAQVPSLLLLLYRDGPVLPSDVWMPLAPLLGYLSQYSPEAAELASRLQAVATGTFASAPQRPDAYGSQAYLMPGNAYGFNTAPAGAQMPQVPQSIPTIASHSTVFHELPAGQSRAVERTAPSVGLQNTNNTCYMNSFMQALFLTDAFFWRIYGFKLKLKDNPKDIDKKDHEFGEIVVDLLQKQFAKMALTRHKHTDIWDILQAFPAEYRSGEQQDVTETIRFVFDKLGGSEQSLLKEIFAGQLQEKIQCKECGNVRVREETFTDLVVPVPTEDAVKASGIVPTIQMLLEQRLQFEEMDSDNLVECEHCQRKTQAGKWSEITSPPFHLCLCLNRFTFSLEKMDFTKEKTPVKVDEGLRIGPYEYELYHAIIHTGKDASSGHYYAMGKRSEPVPSGDMGFYTMDDSQIKPAEMSLLAGNPPEKLLDDNAYVVFLRCKQAPPTPELRVPLPLLDFVKEQDKKM